MVPTPVIYFGQRELGLESSAVVTASHNPPQYTGFKFCREDSIAMSRDGGMREIEAIYTNKSFDEGSGELSETDLEEEYVEAVLGEVGSVDLDVVVDTGNGVAGPLAEKLFEALGCELEVLNREVDGSFPEHLPDPTSEEAKQYLRDRMSDQDLGVVIDGDGDRAGFIVPGYGEVSEDEAIAMISRHLLEGSGTVIHDLRASKLVSEEVEDAGGEPLESRVGHTFISEMIHGRSDVVFAGELSGHFYFPGIGFPWDDGLLAAAVFSSIVEERDIKEVLDSLPEYPVSPELRIDCPEDEKQRVMDEVRKRFGDRDLSEKDGLKIMFEKGWALVRPSSTEPKMSLRFEADSQQDLKQIRDEVEDFVRSSISSSK
jgi:phosphomannomutase